MARLRLAGLAALSLGALLASNLAGAVQVAGAQTPSNAQRVGVIYFGGPHRAVVDGLRQGLQGLGA